LPHTAVTWVTYLSKIPKIAMLDLFKKSAVSGFIQLTVISLSETGCDFFHENRCTCEYSYMLLFRVLDAFAVSVSPLAV